jgi:hypothetical protein
MSDLAARIRVSALFDGRLQKDLQEFRPTHVISLLDPSLGAHAFPTFASDTVFIQRAFIGDWIERERQGKEARLLVLPCRRRPQHRRRVRGTGNATHAGPGAGRLR